MEVNENVSTKHQSCVTMGRTSTVAIASARERSQMNSLTAMSKSGSKFNIKRHIRLEI